MPPMRRSSRLSQRQGATMRTDPPSLEEHATSSEEELDEDGGEDVSSLLMHVESASPSAPALTHFMNNAFTDTGLHFAPSPFDPTFTAPPMQDWQDVENSFFTFPHAGAFGHHYTTAEVPLPLLRNTPRFASPVAVRPDQVSTARRSPSPPVRGQELGPFAQTSQPFYDIHPFISKLYRSLATKAYFPFHTWSDCGRYIAVWDEAAFHLVQPEHKTLQFGNYLRQLSLYKFHRQSIRENVMPMKFVDYLGWNRNMTYREFKTTLSRKDPEGRLPVMVIWQEHFQRGRIDQLSAIRRQAHRSGTPTRSASATPGLFMPVEESSRPMTRRSAPGSRRASPVKQEWAEHDSLLHSEAAAEIAVLAVLQHMESEIVRLRDEPDGLHLATYLLAQGKEKRHRHRGQFSAEVETEMDACLQRANDMVDAIGRVTHAPI